MGREVLRHPHAHHRHLPQLERAVRPGQRPAPEPGAAGPGGRAARAGTPHAPGCAPGHRAGGRHPAPLTGPWRWLAPLLLVLLWTLAAGLPLGRMLADVTSTTVTVSWKELLPAIGHTWARWPWWPRCSPWGWPCSSPTVSATGTRTTRPSAGGPGLHRARRAVIAIGS